VVSLYVRLEDGDDWRASALCRVEVTLNEVDMRVDNGEFCVARAPEQVAGARSDIVQEWSEQQRSLLSGGRLDGKAGAPPLGIADVEPTCLESAGAQEANGVVGVDAVRTATVGDDLASPRQRGCDLVEGPERSGAGARDMASEKLGPRPDIEKHDAPALEPVDEFWRRELLDLLALAEVLVGENGHFGHVPRSDITNGGPELGYPIAREGVIDPSPVPARAGEAALGKQTQMMRGRRDALARLACDLLDRPLALGEQIDDLGPTPAGQRGCDRCECVEEGGLSVSLVHMFKLSFEYTSVKRECHPLPLGVGCRGMPSCCDARGCDGFFSPRMARRAAERYRKKGVDKTVQRMLAFLEEHGVEGATVLEIGGGVGELQLELLKRGAARTLNLELSPAYDEEALRLAREAGLEGRAERRLHDIAADPGGVESADVVVLHRVVCCYPDYERLLSAAADHARRLLVFSYPPRNMLSRLLLGTQNVLFKLQRKEFRTFAHPPARMLAVIEERGLLLAYTHRPVVWQVAGFERRD
jgi:2-polyprenyl-3-methyl-5-hydroxy-6-metoxy-1,4-benzoquinol methylase